MSTGTSSDTVFQVDEIYITLDGLNAYLITEISTMMAKQTLVETTRLLSKIVPHSPEDSLRMSSPEWAFGADPSDYSVLPSCQHEWVETLGLYRMYKDCKHCQAKWEQTERGEATNECT